MVEPRLESLFTVKRLDSGDYEGLCLPGARGRVFGGQVAAQALRAATLVVDSGRDPQSLHAFFLRPGHPDTPVRYAVTTIKNGRSLTIYRVDAWQGEHLIFTANASFHVAEQSPDYQTAVPAVGPPEAFPESNYVPPGTNMAVRQPVEFRYLDEAPTSDRAAPPFQQTWLRSRSRLTDDPSVHACALTYVSDLTLTRTAHMPLRSAGTTRLGSSLDHSIWFHRAFRADEWLLFSQETTSYSGARALSHGEMYDTAGRLIASVAQEALIRVRANG